MFSLMYLLQLFPCRKKKNTRSIGGLHQLIQWTHPRRLRVGSAVSLTAHAKSRRSSRRELTTFLHDVRREALECLDLSQLRGHITCSDPCVGTDTMGSEGREGRGRRGSGEEEWRNQRRWISCTSMMVLLLLLGLYLRLMSSFERSVFGSCVVLSSCLKMLFGESTWRQ